MKKNLLFVAAIVSLASINAMKGENFSLFERDSDYKEENIKGILANNQERYREASEIVDLLESAAGNGVPGITKEDVNKLRENLNKLSSHGRFKNTSGNNKYIIELLNQLLAARKANNWTRKSVTSKKKNKQNQIQQARRERKLEKTLIKTQNARTRPEIQGSITKALRDFINQGQQNENLQQQLQAEQQRRAQAEQKKEALEREVQEKQAENQLLAQQIQNQSGGSGGGANLDDDAKRLQDAKELEKLYLSQASSFYKNSGNGDLDVHELEVSDGKCDYPLNSADSKMLRTQLVAIIQLINGKLGINNEAGFRNAVTLKAAFNQVKEFIDKLGTPVSDVEYFPVANSNDKSSDIDLDLDLGADDGDNAGNSETSAQQKEKIDGTTDVKSIRFAFNPQINLAADLNAMRQKRDNGYLDPFYGDVPNTYRRVEEIIASFEEEKFRIVDIQNGIIIVDLSGDRINSNGEGKANAIAYNDELRKKFNNCFNQAKITDPYFPANVELLAGDETDNDKIKNMDFSRNIYVKFYQPSGQYPEGADAAKEQFGEYYNSQDIAIVRSLNSSTAIGEFRKSNFSRFSAGDVKFKTIEKVKKFVSDSQGKVLGGTITVDEILQQVTEIPVNWKDAEKTNLESQLKAIARTKKLLDGGLATLEDEKKRAETFDRIVEGYNPIVEAALRNAADKDAALRQIQNKIRAKYELPEKPAPSESNPPSAAGGLMPPPPPPPPGPPPPPPGASSAETTVTKSAVTEAEEIVNDISLFNDNKTDLCKAVAEIIIATSFLDKNRVVPTVDTLFNGFVDYMGAFLSDNIQTKTEKLNKCDVPVSTIKEAFYKKKENADGNKKVPIIDKSIEALKTYVRINEDRKVVVPQKHNKSLRAIPEGLLDMMKEHPSKWLMDSLWIEGKDKQGQFTFAKNATKNVKKYLNEVKEKINKLKGQKELEISCNQLCNICNDIETFLGKINSTQTLVSKTENFDDKYLDNLKQTLTLEDSILELKNKLKGLIEIYRNLEVNLSSETSKLDESKTKLAEINSDLTIIFEQMNLALFDIISEASYITLQDSDKKVVKSCAEKLIRLTSKGIVSLLNHIGINSNTKTKDGAFMLKGQKGSSYSSMQAIVPSLIAYYELLKGISLNKPNDDAEIQRILGGFFDITKYESAQGKEWAVFADIRKQFEEIDRDELENFMKSTNIFIREREKILKNLNYNAIPYFSADLMEEKNFNYISKASAWMALSQIKDNIEDYFVPKDIYEDDQNANAALGILLTQGEEASIGRTVRVGSRKNRVSKKAIDTKAEQKYYLIDCGKKEVNNNKLMATVPPEKDLEYLIKIFGLRVKGNDLSEEKSHATDVQQAIIEKSDLIKYLTEVVQATKKDNMIPTHNQFFKAPSTSKAPMTTVALSRTDVRKNSSLIFLDFLEKLSESPTKCEHIRKSDNYYVTDKASNAVNIDQTLIGWASELDNFLKQYGEEAKGVHFSPTMMLFDAISGIVEVLKRVFGEKPESEADAIAQTLGRKTGKALSDLVKELDIVILKGALNSRFLRKENIALVVDAIYESGRKEDLAQILFDSYKTTGRILYNATFIGEKQAGINKQVVKSQHTLPIWNAMVECCKKSSQIAGTEELFKSSCMISTARYSAQNTREILVNLSKENKTSEIEQIIDSSVERKEMNAVMEKIINEGVSDAEKQGYLAAKTQRDEAKSDADNKCKKIEDKINALKQKIGDLGDNEDKKYNVTNDEGNAVSGLTAYAQIKKSENELKQLQQQYEAKNKELEEHRNKPEYKGFSNKKQLLDEAKEEKKKLNEYKTEKENDIKDVKEEIKALDNGLKQLEQDKEKYKPENRIETQRRISLFGKQQSFFDYLKKKKLNSLTAQGELKEVLNDKWLSVELKDLVFTNDVSYGYIQNIPPEIPASMSSSSDFDSGEWDKIDNAFSLVSYLAKQLNKANFANNYKGNREKLLIMQTVFLRAAYLAVSASIKLSDDYSDKKKEYFRNKHIRIANKIREIVDEYATNKKADDIAFPKKVELTDAITTSNLENALTKIGEALPDSFVQKYNSNLEEFINSVKGTSEWSNIQESDESKIGGKLDVFENECEKKFKLLLKESLLVIEKYSREEILDLENSIQEYTEKEQAKKEREQKLADCENSKNEIENKLTDNSITINELQKEIDNAAQDPNKKQLLEDDEKLGNELRTAKENLDQTKKKVQESEKERDDLIKQKNDQIEQLNELRKDFVKAEETLGKVIFSTLKDKAIDTDKIVANKDVNNYEDFYTLVNTSGALFNLANSIESDREKAAQRYENAKEELEKFNESFDKFKNIYPIFKDVTNADGSTTSNIKKAIEEAKNHEEILTRLHKLKKLYYDRNATLTELRTRYNEAETDLQQTNQKYENQKKKLNNILKKFDEFAVKENVPFLSNFINYTIEVMKKAEAFKISENMNAYIRVNEMRNRVEKATENNSAVKKIFDSAENFLLTANNWSENLPANGDEHESANYLYSNESLGAIADGINSGTESLNDAETRNGSFSNNQLKNTKNTFALAIDSLKKEMDARRDTLIKSITGKNMTAYHKGIGSKIYSDRDLDKLRKRIDQLVGMIETIRTNYDVLETKDSQISKLIEEKENWDYASDILTNYSQILETLGKGNLGLIREDIEPIEKALDSRISAKINSNDEAKRTLNDFTNENQNIAIVSKLQFDIANIAKSLDYNRWTEEQRKNVSKNVAAILENYVNFFANISNKATANLLEIAKGNNSTADIAKYKYIPEIRDSLIKFIEDEFSPNLRPDDETFPCNIALESLEQIMCAIQNQESSAKINKLIQANTGLSITLCEIKKQNIGYERLWNKKTENKEIGEKLVHIFSAIRKKKALEWNDGDENILPILDGAICSFIHKFDKNKNKDTANKWESALEKMLNDNCWLYPGKEKTAIEKLQKDGSSIDKEEYEKTLDILESLSTSGNGMNAPIKFAKVVINPTILDNFKERMKTIYDIGDDSKGPNTPDNPDGGNLPPDGGPDGGAPDPNNGNPPNDPYKNLDPLAAKSNVAGILDYMQSWGHTEPNETCKIGQNIKIVDPTGKYDGLGVAVYDVPGDNDCGYHSMDPRWIRRHTNMSGNNKRFTSADVSSRVFDLDCILNYLKNNAPNQAEGRKIVRNMILNQMSAILDIPTEQNYGGLKEEKEEIKQIMAVDENKIKALHNISYPNENNLIKALNDAVDGWNNDHLHAQDSVLNEYAIGYLNYLKANSIYLDIVGYGVSTAVAFINNVNLVRLSRDAVATAPTPRTVNVEVPAATLQSLPANTNLSNLKAGVTRTVDIKKTATGFEITVHGGAETENGTFTLSDVTKSSSDQNKVAIKYTPNDTASTNIQILFEAGDTRPTVYLVGGQGHYTRGEPAADQDAEFKAKIKGGGGPKAKGAGGNTDGSNPPSGGTDGGAGSNPPQGPTAPAEKKVTTSSGSSYDYEDCGNTPTENMHIGKVINAKTKNKKDVVMLDGKLYELTQVKDKSGNVVKGYYYYPGEDKKKKDDGLIFKGLYNTDAKKAAQAVPIHYVKKGNGPADVVFGAYLKNDPNEGIIFEKDAKSLPTNVDAKVQVKQFDSTAKNVNSDQCTEITVKLTNDGFEKDVAATAKANTGTLVLAETNFTYDKKAYDTANNGEEITLKSPTFGELKLIKDSNNTSGNTPGFTDYSAVKVADPSGGDKELIFVYSTKVAAETTKYFIPAICTEFGTVMAKREKNKSNKIELAILYEENEAKGVLVEPEAINKFKVVTKVNCRTFDSPENINETYTMFMGDKLYFPQEDNGTLTYTAINTKGEKVINKFNVSKYKGDGTDKAETQKQ